MYFLPDYCPSIRIYDPFKSSFPQVFSTEVFKVLLILLLICVFFFIIVITLFAFRVMSISFSHSPRKFASCDLICRYGQKSLVLANCCGFLVCTVFLITIT